MFTATLRATSPATGVAAGVSVSTTASTTGGRLPGVCILWVGVGRQIGWAYCGANAPNGNRVPGGALPRILPRTCRGSCHGFHHGSYSGHCRRGSCRRSCCQSCFYRVLRGPSLSVLKSPRKVAADSRERRVLPTSVPSDYSRLQLNPYLFLFEVYHVSQP